MAVFHNRKRGTVRTHELRRSSSRTEGLHRRLAKDETRPISKTASRGTESRHALRKGILAWLRRSRVRVRFGASQAIGRDRTHCRSTFESRRGSQDSVEQYAESVPLRESRRRVSTAVMFAIRSDLGHSSKRLNLHVVWLRFATYGDTGEVPDVPGVGRRPRCTKAARDRSPRSSPHRRPRGLSEAEAPAV